MEKLKLRPMGTAPRGRAFFVVYSNAYYGRRIGSAIYKQSRSKTGSLFWRLATPSGFNLDRDQLDGWLESSEIIDCIDFAQLKDGGE